MRPANEAVPDACCLVFVADGAAEEVVARAEGVADGFFDTPVGFAEAVEVPVADGEFDAEPVAEGWVAARPASDFTSSALLLWPGRSTTASDTTMSTAAADRNSHRFDTGPP
jgi:hypothetical protein